MYVRISISAVNIIPKCNILPSIHRSPPGQVNSLNVDQDTGVGYSSLREGKNSLYNARARSQ